ncbi:Acriflavine resistance protein B [Planctomycetales bacterium 10988]|nr:Acriflavine resistance protein B [Planctomycetales bacterium 10988]
MLKGMIRFCIQEAWLVVLAGLIVGVLGWVSFRMLPIDAIPNVGENQVIVLTEWPGQSPKDIEDQITYPLSVSLLGIPGAKSVRGKSLFGSSFVQVTFEDHLDFYWARSRVAEQLTTIASKLPPNVTPQLGPDATGLGQIFYYVLLPPPEGKNLAELRSLQDFVVKYELQAVSGVSEVSSIGGYQQQYQLEVDPDKLRFFELSIDQVLAAVQGSSSDIGAKTIEQNGMELIIRSKGYLGSAGDTSQVIMDLQETVIQQRNGTPIRIKEIGEVQLGPAFRRGGLDYNGVEAVGGVVVMQFGQNPREVIDRVKQKIEQITPSLSGVTIKPIYDRTLLVEETVATLNSALRDEVIITCVVILLFLLHLRSSILVAITLPLAVLLSFLAMVLTGLEANIMSLAGIAIAIGTMVDMAIVVSENIYQHLAEWESQGRPGGNSRRMQVVIEATTEVAPAVATAVLTTIVSFLPVFFLTGRDYKLFAPLAWTKTFAIAAALIVAVTLVPALCRIFLRSVNSPRWLAFLVSLVAGLLGGLLGGFVWGTILQETWEISPLVSGIGFAILGAIAGWLLMRERIRPLEEGKVSRLIVWGYVPVLHFFLKQKALFAIFPMLILFLGIGAWLGLPRIMQPIEAMVTPLGVRPNEIPGYVSFKHLLPGLHEADWIALDEGSWFYMPTLYPAASFSQAMQILQTQDQLILAIPEVEEVLGKIGRVDSALDPAPAAMIETYVMLKPREAWRPGQTSQTIWEAINRVATLPGVTPASPLQPIEGRVVMLQSGIKAPIAVRIYGEALDSLADTSLKIAEKLKQSPYVNPGTVNPDIVLGKPYLEFSVDRESAARYGMSVEEVNRLIETALGGKNVMMTVEGRERYAVQVRYPRSLREDMDQLHRLPIVTPNGQVIPLEQLASLSTSWGPGMIQSENARLVAHVSFSISGIAGVLESVQRIEQELRADQQRAKDDPNYLNLPVGSSFEMVGSFRNQIVSNQRLLWLAPLLNIDTSTNSSSEYQTSDKQQSLDLFTNILSYIPLGLVPLAVLINLLILYLQFREISAALIIFASIPVAFAGGLILLGILSIEVNTATWIGFIALFGIAVDDGVVMATYLQQVYENHQFTSKEEIYQATIEAGSRRIRPCLMTTFTTLLALLPVMVSQGRGAEVARAMAYPVVGGMIVAMITVFIVPLLFSLREELKLHTLSDLP